jgi:hypothetical protein
VPCDFFFIISSLPLIGYLVAAREEKREKREERRR